VSPSLTVVVAARAVGGTTPVNSGTCLRPLPWFLAGWDGSPDGRSLAGSLDEWLTEAERQLAVSVPGPELASTSGRLFSDGLRALRGADPFALPRNAAACRGLGRCCFGCPAGAKQGTDRAFLPDAVAHGALIVAGAIAGRIDERPTEVVVHVRGTSRRQRVRARAVVVAAGALETPALVRSSRLGRTWRVAGSSLRIHPTAKVFAWFPGLRHGPRGVPQGLGYRPPELPRVALEGIHTPASVAAPLLSVAGRRTGWWLERLDELATFGLMVADRGAGRVRRVLGYTAVDYALDAADRADLVRGMKLVGRAFFAAGAERVLLPLAGHAEYGSPAELEQLTPEHVTAAEVTAVGFHPQGTAGIGRVVGPDLRIPGCERISICDASVLPDSPGVNPQLTVMALALRHSGALARALGGERSRSAPPSLPGSAS
jgi:choline dehydrogenase-like flavoprotein